jgi:hypothetical protein
MNEQKKQQMGGMNPMMGAGGMMGMGGQPAAQNKQTQIFKPQIDAL